MMSKGSVFDIRIEEAQIRGVIQALKEFEVEKKAGVRREVSRALIDIQRNAKKSCVVGTPESVGKRVYFGARLRSSIFMQTMEDGMSGVVWTDVPYAPYVEFGTGKMVEVPEGLEDFAWQFKGRGVREVNLKARPFLFPAWEISRMKFIENVKKILGMT
jgi:hypothetical protein